jgi:MFS family permease
MFAVAVPVSFRGYVAGVRNALFAVVSIVISLVCGQILIRVAFPANYQIVFALGFIGAMLSSLHLLLLDRKLKAKTNEPMPNLQMQQEQKKESRLLISRITLTRFQWPKLTDNKHYYLVMALLFVFHTAQYLAIPVFPVYWVNNMQLSDGIISIGNGLFFFSVFIGSTQISKLSYKYGNKLIVGIGMLMLALYPGIMAFGIGADVFFIASLVGGLAWSLVGGLLFNYILEKIPEVNRPSYLAIYNFVFYAAILIGSLSGPQIGRIISLPIALIVFAILRLGAGALLLWKG